MIVIFKTGLLRSYNYPNNLQDRCSSLLLVRLAGGLIGYKLGLFICNLLPIQKKGGRDIRAIPNIQEGQNAFYVKGNELEEPCQIIKIDRIKKRAIIQIPQRSTFFPEMVEGNKVLDVSINELSDVSVKRQNSLR